MRIIGQVRVSKFTPLRMTNANEDVHRLGHVLFFHPLILRRLIYTHRLTAKSLYLSLGDRQNHLESPIHNLCTFPFNYIRLLSLLLSVFQIRTVNYELFNVFL